jgi:hypothetical protein
LLSRLTTPQELSGILNWSLEGLRRLQEQNGFTYKLNAEQVRDLWRRQSDSALAFAMDEVEVSPTEYVSKQTLYNAYLAHCSRNYAVPVSESKFHLAIRKNYQVEDFRPAGGDRQRCWRGIKLVRAEPVQPVHPVQPQTSLFSSSGAKEGPKIMVKQSDEVDAVDGPWSTPESLPPSGQGRVAAAYADRVVEAIGRGELRAFEEIARTLGFEEDFLQPVLQHLSSKGVVYEPKAGFWSVL